MSRFKDLKNFNEVKKVIVNDVPGFSNEKLLHLINDKPSHNSKLLLVGEVQSGKTRNIIEFIKSTFPKSERGVFDIIIVFGGTTANLNEQTKNRLEDKKDGLGNLENIRFKDFSTIYSEKNDSMNTILYIGLKSNDELKNILITLRNIPNLKSKRVLIIDDESDFGSINTKELGNPSKYSQIIEEIYNIVSNGSVLMSVTATPYANLLNCKVQPYDHVITLPCKYKYGYKGISFFNNLDDFYLDIEKQKLWENGNVYYEEEWRKLYFVFSIYIINSLVKNSIDMPNFVNTKSDLLINIAYDKKEHKQIVKIIRDILNFCKNGIPSFLNYLETINCKKVTLSKDKVSQILSEINIIELNSDNINTIKSDFNIYVGGVLLSRGITYEALTVEYITNFPKNKISVDTLLQMCRWFGYRENVEEYKYMNVITNKTGIEALKEIEEFNKIFYQYNDNDNGGTKDIACIKNKIFDLENKSKYVVACGSAKR